MSWKVTPCDPGELQWPKLGPSWSNWQKHGGGWQTPCYLLRAFARFGPIWHMLVEFGQTVATIGQNMKFRPIVGQLLANNWPTWGQLSVSGATFRHTLGNFWTTLELSKRCPEVVPEAEIWPTFGQIWPNIGPHWPKLAEHWQILANDGKCRPTLARIGQISLKWVEIDPTLAKFGQHFPIPAKCWPSVLAKCWQSSAELGPDLS